MNIPTPANPRDWRAGLVAAIQSAIAAASSKEQTINDTRIVFSYFVVYFQHLIGWSPEQLAAYVREICDLAEKQTGVRARSGDAS